MESQEVATYRYLTRLIDPPHNYGRRWRLDEQIKAVRDYKDGIPLECIAERLGRSINATRIRVYRLIGKWKIRD